MRIPLANLLVKSPLPRIGELMEAVQACADKLPPLVEAAIAEDSAGLDRLAKETSILEGRADEVKNLVRAELPTRLLLPVDRRDLLRLVSEVDNIADCTEDVGVLFTLRPLPVPEGMQGVLRDFVTSVMDTVAVTHELVASLDSLGKAGFSGRAATAALERVDLISEREHEADKLQDQCAKALFRAEAELAPVALFMWTKVMKQIGDMANHAENVGDQFRLFVAR